MRHNGQTDLGTCCVCEAPDATVLHLLNARCPVPEHGWGCVQCGSGLHGAIAVVCEACATTAEASATPSGMLEDMLRFVCRGYPGSEGRMPIAALRGEHGHHRAKHPEVPQIETLHVLATDTRFGVPVAEGQGCHCSRCGQTIWDGTCAIYAFDESGDWQYRYHPTCFGAIPIDANAYAKEDDDAASPIPATE